MNVSQKIECVCDRINHTQWSPNAGFVITALILWVFIWRIFFTISWRKTFPPWYLHQITTNFLGAVTQEDNQICGSET